MSDSSADCSPNGGEPRAAATVAGESTTALAVYGHRSKSSTTPSTRRTGSSGSEGNDTSKHTSSGRKRHEAQHIGTGLLKGAGNVLGGVALGATALVAAPVAGAVEDGGKGFLKGLGGGIAGALIFPVAGVVAGAKNVSSGAKNTKRTVQERSKGRVFDKETGEWVDKERDLDEEYQERKNRYEYMKSHRPKFPGGLAETGGGGPGTPVETEYYDTLGVAPAASTAEIRKAYYKLAMETHPDKNPGDLDAKRKFQAVSEAYQVLGDEAQRRDYDRHGKAAADNMEFADPGEMFAVLFGTKDFEPLIGELRVAVGLQDDDDEFIHMKQAYRVLELAVKLRDRLQPGVEALRKSEAEFDEWLQLAIEPHARELCAGQFGASFLEAIGFCYDNQAYPYLKEKSLLGGVKAQWRLKKRNMNTICAAVCSASKASKAMKSDAAAAKKKEKSGDSQDPESPTKDGSSGSSSSTSFEKNVFVEEQVIKSFLQFSLHDITVTTVHVCRKYLKDKAVRPKKDSKNSSGESKLSGGEDLRYLRARVLQAVGQVYSRAANEAETTRASSSQSGTSASAL